jgi:predicted phosphoadenosine phosphosulfate sulfurtransferase
MKSYSSTNVYDAAVQRMVDVYKDGHRVLVSFSAGKDSTCAMEVCIQAARITGNLPVEVWMQDEEIMYPGTYEYAERVASRKEVKFHWLICGEPQINIFNRKEPFYWVFDPLLREDQWMRKPPSFARKTDEQDLYNIVNPQSFPPPEGKFLFVCMGVRASESRMRNMMIHSSGGAISKATVIKGSGLDRSNERHIRPIYDWTTNDVWHAINENGWDYNRAYDVFARFGVKRERQRIGPVAMTTHGVRLIQIASKAWPEWFDRLSIRLPGIRLGAAYGVLAAMPVRRPNETWQDAYQRVNIDEAPEWIAERATIYRASAIATHARHSTQPIMEMSPCPSCHVGRVSWKNMTIGMYSGDPYMLNVACPELGYVQPEFFRPGSGYWGNNKPGKFS